MGADGVIISDPGILMIARETVPELPVHLSTQANVTNLAAAKFWYARGVSRLNLARELSLTEIAAIRKEVHGELEVFVHGALCISYSGRCMLSNYMTGRDANQGNCAHPCRYSYALVEEKRPGQYFPVEEDERGTYIFNAKDLCLLENLPQLVAAGVDSLKIEGRMKSIFYVGGVVRVYRAALAYLQALPHEAWSQPENIRIPEEYLEEVLRSGTRGVSANFFAQRPGATEMNYQTSRVEQSYEPVAVVRQTGNPPMVEIRNTILPDTEVEYMCRGIETRSVRITRMLDVETGTAVQKANPGNNVFLECEPPLAEVEVLAIFRRKISS
jgi:putative protease